MQVHSVSSFKNRLRRIQSATAAAARRVDDLVFSYGHLDENDPEREILKGQVAQVLRAWARGVQAYGAIPKELWSVSLETPEGVYEWQYPCSAFQEGFPDS